MQFWEKLKSFLLFKRAEMIQVALEPSSYSQTYLFLAIQLSLVMYQDSEWFNSLRAKLLTFSESIIEKHFFRVLIEETSISLLMTFYLIFYIISSRIWCWILRVCLRGCGGSISNFEFLNTNTIWILWTWSHIWESIGRLFFPSQSQFFNLLSILCFAHSLLNHVQFFPFLLSLLAAISLWIFCILAGIVLFVFLLFGLAFLILLLFSPSSSTNTFSSSSSSSSTFNYLR